MIRNSFTPPEMSIDPFSRNKLIRGYKNTNGNNPFRLFPFRRWQIALPLASGYGYRGWLHRHFLPACAFSIYFCCPLRSDSAVYGFTFLLSLRLPFRVTFPDGVSHRIQRGSSLAIRSSAAGTIPAFQLSCSPGSLRDLHLHFHPLLNSTF